MKPLVFKITLEYRLDACTDSYIKPCPVFDPEDKTRGQTTNTEKNEISRKLPNQILNFNLCEDAENCLCDIKASIRKAIKITARATTDMLVTTTGMLVATTHMLVTTTGTLSTAIGSMPVTTTGTLVTTTGTLVVTAKTIVTTYGTQLIQLLL